MAQRVDSMENAIGNIMGKIDAVLVHLEGMERTKYTRQQSISNILDSITTVRVQQPDMYSLVWWGKGSQNC